MTIVEEALKFRKVSLSLISVSPMSISLGKYGEIAIQASIVSCTY